MGIFIHVKKYIYVMHLCSIECRPNMFYILFTPRGRYFMFFKLPLFAFLAHSLKHDTITYSDIVLHCGYIKTFGFFSH